MKKTKQSKPTSEKIIMNKNATAEYAAQDFEQGRGGMQSGHSKNEQQGFTQFQNTGDGSYAATPAANSKIGAIRKNKK